MHCLRILIINNEIYHKILNKEVYEIFGFKTFCDWIHSYWFYQFLKLDSISNELLFTSSYAIFLNEICSILNYFYEFMCCSWCLRQLQIFLNWLFFKKPFLYMFKWTRKFVMHLRYLNLLTLAYTWNEKIFTFCLIFLLIIKKLIFVSQLHSTLLFSISQHNSFFFEFTTISSYVNFCGIIFFFEVVPPSSLVLDKMSYYFFGTLLLCFCTFLAICFKRIREYIWKKYFGCYSSAHNNSYYYQN